MTRTPGTGPILLAALLLSASGCDKQTESSRNLEEAAAKMATLTTEGVIGDPEGTSNRAVYREVLQLVSTPWTDGTAAEKAAAALLEARSHAGLAKDPTGQAATLEIRARALASTASTQFEAWLQHIGEAEAASAYDPTSDIEAVRAELATLDQELKQLREQKREVDQEIAELRELAASRLSSAGTERAAVGDLELRASRLSATEAMPLVRDAYTRRRQADTLEREALGLVAQADRITPTANELQLDMSRLEAQRALLERDAQIAQERSDQGGRDAAESRGLADEAAVSIDQAIGELNELRSGALGTAYQDATQKFEAAATSARRAKSEARFQASAVEGQVLDELAQLRRIRASRLDEDAHLLRKLGESDLPRAAEYAEIAITYAERSAEQADLAHKTDEDARAALESAGLLEQPQDSFDDAPADFTDAGAGGGAWDLVDRTVGIANARDIASFPALFHAETAQAQSALDFASGLMSSYASLDQAVQAQFGQGLMEQSMAELDEQVASGTLQPEQAEAARQIMNGQLERDFFLVREEGDLAFIGFNNQDASGVELRAGLVGAEWKFLIGDPEISMIPIDPTPIFSVLDRYGAQIIQAMDTVTGQVERGELNDIAAVEQSLQLQMQPLGMQLMGDPEVQQLMQQVMEQQGQTPPGGP